MNDRPIETKTIKEVYTTQEDQAIKVWRATFKGSKVVFFLDIKDNEFLMERKRFLDIDGALESYYDIMIKTYKNGYELKRVEQI